MLSQESGVNQTVSIVRRVKIAPGDASNGGGVCQTTNQHVITDVISGVGGTGTGFDYYQIESTTPAPMLVLNIAKQPNYTSTANIVDKDVNTANAALADVTSEFSNAVMTVDEDSALGKNPLNWGNDALHPNDQGHAIIAQAAYKTLVNAPVNVQQASFGESVAPSTNYLTTTNYSIQDYNNQPTFSVNTTAVQPG